MKKRIIAIVAMLSVLGGFSVLTAQAADYTLAMSEEKQVCQVMLQFANEGLLQTMQLEQPQGFEAPGFEFVKWSTIPHADSFRSHNGNIKGALFDINNDGQLDWVVRMQWALGGFYSHELLIYSRRQEPLFQETGFALEDEQRADARLNYVGRGYFLTKIPKVKNKKEPKKKPTYYYSIVPAYLIPFQFNGLTYILMANPFAWQELLPDGRRFAVVTSYLTSFQLQDICYLEKIH